MNIKTCEEYVLSELDRLQRECERMQKRIEELEFENNHLHNRIGKMESTAMRLTKENVALTDRLRELSRDALLDSTWANERGPVDGIE